MAIRVVNTIPGIDRIGKKTDLAARKELLIKDIEKIVRNRIENCEIVDIGFSRAYGKSLLENLIRRWCLDTYGRKHVNSLSLANAFTVVSVKEEDRYRYFIHFSPDIWDNEFNSRNKPKDLREGEARSNAGD